MMKRAVISIFLVLLIMLTGCSNDESAESETAGVQSEVPAPSCRELLSVAIDIVGEDNITIYSNTEGDEELGSYLISDLYGSIDVIPEQEKIGDAAIYLPDNQVVNEVHILKPKTDADAEDIEVYLENRYERLKVTYVGYDPEQAGYASNSKITNYKGYYIYVATKDKNDEIIKALKNSIDGK